MREMRVWAEELRAGVGDKLSSSELPRYRLSELEAAGVEVEDYGGCGEAVDAE
jgi:hypothetical protein